MIEAVADIASEKPDREISSHVVLCKEPLYRTFFSKGTFRTIIIIYS
jgi:hypothetical protein